MDLDADDGSVKDIRGCIDWVGMVGGVGVNSGVSSGNVGRGVL